MSALTGVTSLGGHIILKQMFYITATEIHLDKDIVIE